MLHPFTLTDIPMGSEAEVCTVQMTLLSPNPTVKSPVTLNNASDYRANGHYRTISDGLTG